MSFQAYLNNIQEKQEFELGHGHAMAIYALLKGKKLD